MTLRAGIVINWVPDRVLYVTDPAHDALIAMTLVDDGQVFRVTQTRPITAAGLDRPVDIAPAVPETANPLLASNTTHAGGSDLYVVSRGSSTLLRLRQDGTVLATRQVAVDGMVLGAGRLNGIAVSPDAQRLWVTMSGALPGHEEAPGALLELPAFGPGRAASLPGRDHGLQGGPLDVAAPAPGCDAPAALDDDGTTVHAVAAYVGSLAPLPPDAPASGDGETVFAHAGYDACHARWLPGHNGQAVPLFSDLLLHDMGPTLDDGVT